MSNFKDEYLRILTPRTTDGVNLKYGPDKQPTYKESHAPITARKSFDKENSILPDQLKHIIEHVGGVETTDVSVTPSAPRPQRVPRSNPKPTVVTTTPVKPVQIIVDSEEKAEVKEVKQPKKEEVKRRHRRTRKEIENAN